jgi:hypothetical protein
MNDAGWLRLEAAVVVLHKVGGGIVFGFNYLSNKLTVTVTVMTALNHPSRAHEGNS